MTCRGGENDYYLDSSQEYGLLDGSGCSTRISSDDLRIIERLQLLTQRVEELEHKLETSLSNRSDDLSFDFSVNDCSPVPKIDIKVLAGPKRSRSGLHDDENCYPAGGSNELDGWDEATVERNASFIIIPVGNDKGSELSNLQKEKQTQTVELQSSASVSVWTSLNDLSPVQESIESTEELATTDSTPSDENLGEESSQSSKVEESCFVDDYNEKEILGSSRNKGKTVRQMAKGMSNLNATCVEQNSPNTQRFSYGYTISIAGLSPRYENNRPTLEQFGTSDGTSISMVNGGCDRVEIAVDLGDDETDCYQKLARQPRNVLTSSSQPNKAEGRYINLATPQTVCLEAVTEDFIELRKERSRNFNDMDFARGEVFADKSITSDLELSKHDLVNHNGVDSSAPNSYSIDRHCAQLRNAETEISETRTNAMTAKPVQHEGGHYHLHKIGERTRSLPDRFKEVMIDHDNRQDERVDMQMLSCGSQRLRNGNSFDENSLEARRPINNATVSTTAKNRLIVNNDLGNTNNRRVKLVESSDSAQRGNSKNDKTLSTPTVRRVRARSVDPAPTSSDEDVPNGRKSDLLATYGDSTHVRQHRRRPKARFGRAVENTQNRVVVVGNSPKRSDASFEKQLRDLIDPSDIGNLREELASRPRSLLAELTPISPTESGYVEGSSFESTSEVWRDHESVFESEKSTPVYSTTLSLKPKYSPDSPYSSLTSISSANEIFYPQKESSPKRSYHEGYNFTTSSPGLLKTLVQESREEISISRDSPKVSYIGRDFPVSNVGTQIYKSLQLPSIQINSSHSRLADFFPNTSRLPLASPTSSIITSDFSDTFLECQCESQCECQTGILTKEDFREELKLISRYVLNERTRSTTRIGSKPTRKYYLDEEQGEMDIFGTKLQRGEHKAVPMLVKVILRLRKHFFGGIEGPSSLKSLTPRDKNTDDHDVTTSGSANPQKKKISFSPAAMLLSAVGESSASEIRDVIEKDRLDVNQLSPSGKSLLHKAAAAGDLESIHILIQYGALVNLTDQDGFAPINSALRRSHYKCAIFLLECGTDMSAYTKTRIQELVDIRNMADVYLRTVLNTAL